jgi:short-subunit dehydrogenase
MPNTAFKTAFGPWAVVTGASDGIGHSFALALAKRGVHLILTARREPLLQELAASLRRRYEVQVVVVAADYASPAGVALTLSAIEGREIGLLVCSAGFGTAGPFLQNELADELQMIQVNCSALADLSWHMGQKMVSQGRGGLILLSSIVAFQGVPRSANYAATKAYVQTLAEGLNGEWASQGVPVMAVAPGPVQTGFAARSNLRMGKAAHPDVVAEESLCRLGKQVTVRPGWLAKVLGYGLASAPRWVRVRIMGVIMKGMTRHLPG